MQESEEDLTRQLKSLQAHVREHKEQAEIFFKEQVQQDSQSEDDLERSQHVVNYREGGHQTFKKTRLSKLKCALVSNEGLMQSENFRTLKLTIQSNGTLGEMDAEQERLRESYSQTRQQRRANTKSRSRSGIRKNRKNNLNDTSGTFMARETSDFRKIYDNQT